jgi:hypothetical protein
MWSRLHGAFEGEALGIYLVVFDSLLVLVLIEHACLVVVLSS